MRRLITGGRRGAWRAAITHNVWLPLLLCSGVFVATGIGSQASVAGAVPASTPITLNPNLSPFVSGQFVEVKLAPNAVLKPGAHLTIEECSAASVGETRRHFACDPRTRQTHSFEANPDGSADYQGYPIYALPDVFTLHETRHHRPVCNLEHACVLLVGWDIDDVGHEVWSIPFFASPTAGDTGTGPGTGTPEVPYVLALPVLALGILGATVLLRRRRSVSPGPADVERSDIPSDQVYSGHR